MKLLTILLALVLAATAAFAALNWDAINALSTLSLGVTTIEAPLGGVLLGLMVLATALLAAYVVYLQGTALIETRRSAKELLASRQLADQAEASRFTDLKAFLDQALAAQTQRQEQSQAQLLARVAQLDTEWRSALEQSGNTLAAYIGELEDRVESQLASRPVS